MANGLSPQAVDAAFGHVAGELPVVGKKEKRLSPSELDTGGAMKVGSVAALNELLFGVPELAWKRAAKPEDRESWEKLKSEHKLAGMVGGGLGLAGSLAIPGGVAKLAGKGVGLGARMALPSAKYFGLGEKAAEAIGRTGLRAGIKPIAQAAGKGSIEAMTYAAPKIAGEVALGEGDAGEKAKSAIIETLLTTGLGGAAGAVGKVAGAVLPEMKSIETLKKFGFKRGQIVNAAGQEKMNLGEVSDIIEEGLKKHAGNKKAFIDELKQNASNEYQAIGEVLAGKKVQPYTLYRKKDLLDLDLSTQQKIKKIFEDVPRDSENYILNLGSRINEEMRALRQGGQAGTREYLFFAKYKKNLDDAITNMLGGDKAKGIYREAQKQWKIYKTLDKISQQTYGGTFSEILGGGSDTAIKLAMMGSPAIPGMSEAGQKLSEGDIAGAVGGLAKAGAGYAGGRVLHAKAIPALVSLLEKMGTKVPPEIATRAIGGIVPSAIPEAQKVETTPEEKKAVPPEVTTPEAVTEAVEPTAKTTAWYENPNGKQILTQALQDRYNAVVEQGLLPPEVSFEGFVGKMAEKTRNFDPLAIAHWFYDKEELKEFRKEYGKWQQQQRSFSEIDAMIPQLEKFGVTSGITLVGGKAKVAADKIADMLTQYEAGDKQARVENKRKNEQEIYDILRNMSLSFEEKLAAIKGRFALDSTTYLEGMGIV